jgi:hypothetical protein
MSNHFDTPSSTQPDWQAQYSYTTPIEKSTIAHPHRNGNNYSEAGQPRFAEMASATLDIEVKKEQSSPLEPFRDDLDPSGQPQVKHSAITENSEPQPDKYAPRPFVSNQNNSFLRPDTSTLTIDSNSLPPVSAMIHSPDRKLSHSGQAQVTTVGHGAEDDEQLDDDEIVEAEESISQPQTAAERIAQRRKMKRFR